MMSELQMYSQELKVLKGGGLSGMIGYALPAGTPEENIRAFARAVDQS